MSDLPWCPAAHGGPAASAVLRAEPEDFRVVEIMNVVPEGEGEHLWLEIEKTNWNTEDVALWLAKSAAIHRLSVGYSGLKDRRAITRQWFSLHLPGKDDPPFDWPAGLRLLNARRHRRKLNRGTHRGNHFELRLRAVDGDRDVLEHTLQRIALDGVPNYFGEQRFGRQGANWQRGLAWLAGGGAKSLSAIRSTSQSAADGRLSSPRPGLEQSNVNVITRSAWSSAITWPTMPPMDRPTTWARAIPCSSMTAQASSARSASV